MKSALRRSPSHHKAGTMARAKALSLEEDRAELVRAALFTRRAVDGQRALLAAGLMPDLETVGRMLASVAEFADQVHDHLTGRRSR